MKLRIETKNGILEATSNHVGRKSSDWKAKPFQHNEVTLRFALYEDIRVIGNEEDSFTTETFDFWGSKISPKLETEYDLGNAVLCIIQDANYGNYEYEDFCDSLGLEPYQSCGNCRRGESERLYDECLSIQDRLPMPTNENFLCDLIDELSEKYA